MRKFGLILCILMAGLSGLVFAGTTDIYAAVPLNFDKTNSTEINGTGIGAGIMSSTLKRDGIFGVTMGFTGYYPMELSYKLGNSFYTSSVSDEYSVPFGMDVMLGITLNPIKIGIFSLPIILGAHAKADFLKAGPNFDFGVVGNAGVKATFGGFGIFARAQVSYDFYRTRFADDSWNSDFITVFGVQPQVGISFSGK